MTLKLSITGSERLDSMILDARADYARERLDFHDYFPTLTARDILRVLKGTQGDPQERRETVQTLFAAQQSSPHELWELLLVAAAAPILIKRAHPHVAIGRERVIDLAARTFVEALQAIPSDVYWEDVGAHVFGVSAVAFAAGLETLTASEVA